METEKILIQVKMNKLIFREKSLDDLMETIRETASSMFKVLGLDN